MKTISFRENSLKQFIYCELKKGRGVELIVGQLKLKKPELKNPRGRIYRLAKQVKIKILKKHVVRRKK